MSEEKIISIEEVENYKEDYDSWDGFIVKTSKQKIKLLIDNSQQCCESFGYFWSNDKPQDFIGATLRSVSVTDDALNTKKIDELYMDEGAVMFVTFDTSAGQLQFVAYNDHNGFYSHEARVECTQLNRSEWL